MSFRYVQSKNGAFIRHINDAEPTRWNDDCYCYVGNLTDEQIAEFGVSKLVLVTPPAYDIATQTRSEGDAIFVNGNWHQNWIVINLATDEVEAIKARYTQVFENERSAKLAETDWWAVRASEPGAAPMTDAQLAYRQALRVMDDAADFDVFNPIWPEKP